MSDNLEIERKFLVIASGWQNPSEAKKIAQGYIMNDKSVVVRVRQKGDKSFLTIKADQGEALTRLEFEYEIPNKDCEQMLQTICGDAIQKTRHIVKIGPHTWEIDEFHGANSGLIMAEIELESVDQAFEKPDWIGPEVSHNPRFFNAYIAEHPFSTWGINQDDLIKEFSEK
jgi:adenylate cyclase